MEDIADGLRTEAVTGVSARDYQTFEKVLKQIKCNLVALDQTEQPQLPRS